MAWRSTAGIIVRATDQSMATATTWTPAESAATATTAGATAPPSLSPGEHISRGTSANCDADVSGRDESPEDMRGHSRDVREDLKN